MTQFNGKYYLFGNWKMYLDLEESQVLAKALKKDAHKFGEEIKMAVFPSSLSITMVKEILEGSGIGIGAQNAYWVDKGGYTGEVSDVMYKKIGCEYILVGHSERRHQFHETDHEVRQKMEAVLDAGLSPVLCVGETQKERAEGKEKEVVEIQLRTALDSLNLPKGHELVVAYEPVWAIGTGEACDPSEAEYMHELILKICDKLLPGVSVVLLYGGSVRPENVAGYLTQKNVHGVLVGGASTKHDEWLEITKHAQTK